VLFRQQYKRTAFNELDRGRINLLTYQCPEFTQEKEVLRLLSICRVLWEGTFLKHQGRIIMGEDLQQVTTGVAKVNRPPAVKRVDLAVLGKPR
jgi:hypothetical protein